MNSIINLFPVDPHYVSRTRFTRAQSSAAANESAGAKAKVTRTTPPSFVCVSDVETLGDNTFVKSIGIANPCGMFLGLSRDKIDCFSFSCFTTRFSRASRVHEAVAGEQVPIPKRDARTSVNNSASKITFASVLKIHLEIQNF